MRSHCGRAQGKEEGLRRGVASGDSEGPGCRTAYCIHQPRPGAAPAPAPTPYPRRTSNPICPSYASSASHRPPGSCTHTSAPLRGEGAGGGGARVSHVPARREMRGSAAVCPAPQLQGRPTTTLTPPRTHTHRPVADHEVELGAVQPRHLCAAAGGGATGGGQPTSAPGTSAPGGQVGAPPRPTHPPGPAPHLHVLACAVKAQHAQHAHAHLAAHPCGAQLLQQRRQGGRGPRHTVVRVEGQDDQAAAALAQRRLACTWGAAGEGVWA